MDDFQERVISGLSRIEQQLKTTDERLNDHGQRLRALERIKNWAAGVGAGLALLVYAPSKLIALLSDQK